MSKKFDVIVVGAGPGGSQAAENIAKGGLSVALIERKEVPGTPVRCGEGVGFKGMDASIGIEPHWILAKVKEVGFISPEGRRVAVRNLGPQSVCVDRTIMDRELMERAVAAGATYINNTYIDRVEVTRDTMHNPIYHCYAGDEIYEAPLLIAADGVESRIKRFCGWNKPFKMIDMESCAFAKVRHDSIRGDALEFYVGEQIAPSGYLWVFPRGDGFANVGLGVLGQKAKPGLAKSLLNAFIKDTFPGGEVTDFHCGGVPVAAWTDPLVKEGVMLVGDAAGQVNALNGGGIAYALYAGKKCGEVVVKNFKNGTFNYSGLHQYQKDWNKYCGKNQKRSHALKTALLKRRDPFYNHLAQALSKEDPDKLSYLRVFMRVFSKHPLLLLKTFLLFK